MSTTPDRRRRGAETRRRVEEAAARLFTGRGYTATSMQAIAEAAGVHVQTIYLAYGTKAAVLAACAARLVAGEEDPETHPSERRWAREIEGTGDPRRKIELYVRHLADVAARTTPLLDVLRATAPSEPEAAAFLTHMEEGRREGPLQLLGPLAGTAAARPGLTAGDIADIAFALASPDTLRALVTMRGWQRGRAEAWLSATLCRELLADPREIALRPLRRDDFPLLARWLAEPAVARWWNHEFTPEAVERDFGPSVDGRDPTEMFLALSAGRPFGLIQRYRIAAEPEYAEELSRVCAVPPGALSIDYLIGEPGMRGSGLGARMIAAMVARTWDAYPDAGDIIVPVVAGNVASWRALERAGFARIAEGDLEPDNPIDGPAHVIYAIRRPAG